MEHLQAETLTAKEQNLLALMRKLRPDERDVIEQTMRHVADRDEDVAEADDDRQEIEALLNIDTRDPVTWTDAMREKIALWDGFPPHANQFGIHDLAELRHLVVEEVALRETRPAQAHESLLFEVIRQRTQDPVGRRLLDDLKEAVCEIENELMNVCIDVVPKLGQVLPLKSSDELLAAMGYPRSNAAPAEPDEASE